MPYVAVALHNTGHGPAATVICTAEEPLNPLCAAKNAETLGYQFYENETGALVFFLMDFEYLFKDQLNYAGDRPPVDYPIVYRRIRRNGEWVTEWLDQDLAHEYENDPLNLPSTLVLPTVNQGSPVPVVVRVVDGDIIKYPADAIISLTGSVSMWQPGVDEAIQRIAGRQYHDQLSGRQLEQNQVVHTVQRQPHSGAFRDVIFLIDDTWDGPLSELVQAGLETADRAGLASVTLPTLRINRGRSVVDKGIHEAVRQLAIGVDSFLRRHPVTSLRTITIVVDHNPDLQDLVIKWLAGRVTVN